MKKVIIIAGIFSLILSACTNNKLATYSDDIYANPSEERVEKARLAAEKKKKQEEEAKKEAEERAAELAAQKAKDDANPAYKDPVYDKDDYYDYQYASRIRRFNNPVTESVTTIITILTPTCITEILPCMVPVFTAVTIIGDQAIAITIVFRVVILV